MRVTLRISQNPLRAGQRAVAWVTVKNTGRNTLHWMVDGCGVNAWVSATLPGLQWRASTATLTPQLRAYSTWLQTRARLERPPYLKFEPGSLLGWRDYGCADLGIPRSLKPGASTTDEVIWDGQLANRLGPPQASPAVITATFARWQRGNAEAPPPDQKPIVVTIDSWVVDGPPSAFLSPSEAIDAALEDPEFGGWIIKQPLPQPDGVVEYDQDVDLWIVGLTLQENARGSLRRAAFVEPLSGKVVSVREYELRR